MQLVDRLSVRAIFNRLDKRKLQYELDTHRLYLITSHFDRLHTGDHKSCFKPHTEPIFLGQYLRIKKLELAGEDFGEQYVQKLAAEAQQLGHEV